MIMGFLKKMFFVEVDEIDFKVTLACGDDAHTVVKTFEVGFFVKTPTQPQLNST